MVNGEELRGITRRILNILDSRKVRSLEGLNHLAGTNFPFANGEVLQINFGISGSLITPNPAIKIFYSRPDWGIVINTSSNPHDNFTMLLLKTTASVFSYAPSLKDPFGRTIYEKKIPGAYFKLLKRELEKLTNKNYYLTE